MPSSNARKLAALAQNLPQSTVPLFTSASGTSDALTATYTPAVTVLTNGMIVSARATAANGTATPTFTPNPGVITAKAIVKGAGVALNLGDISGAGYWCDFRYDATFDKWILLNPAFGPLNVGYMLVRDEKAQGTAGGSSVAGIQTRVLNTVAANTITGASLVANQITLPIGTYRVSGYALAGNVNLHRSFLYSITSSSPLVLGTSLNGADTGTADGIATLSNIKGRFTITDTTIIELRHYTSQAVATLGLGAAVNSTGNEIFAEVEIIKES